MLAPSPLNPILVGAWNNGVQSVNDASLSSGQSTDIQIGTGGTNFFDGFIQEIIGYQSNANRLEKETNINNYWTIFP